MARSAGVASRPAGRTSTDAPEASRRCVDGAKNVCLIGTGLACTGWQLGRASLPARHRREKSMCLSVSLVGKRAHSNEERGTKCNRTDQGEATRIGRRIGRNGRCNLAYCGGISCLSLAARSRNVLQAWRQGGIDKGGDWRVSCLRSRRELLGQSAGPLGWHQDGSSEIGGLDTVTGKERESERPDSTGNCGQSAGQQGPEQRATKGNGFVL